MTYIITALSKLMKAKLQHVFLNVSDPKISFPFYEEFMGILGYKIEFKSENQLGLNNGNTEIWLRKAKEEGYYNRNSIGLNHIAFRVNNESDVKEFCSLFLHKNGIKPLYDSPRIFPEFTDDYYAVYFEDPDSIKLEITSYTFEFE